MKLINETGQKLSVDISVGGDGSEHFILNRSGSQNIPKNTGGIYLHSFDQKSWDERFKKSDGDATHLKFGGAKGGKDWICPKCGSKDYDPPDMDAPGVPLCSCGEKMVEKEIEDITQKVVKECDYDTEESEVNHIRNIVKFVIKQSEG
ncbi:MAG: hypothetical protein KAU20_07920 [Nanoarchaeota archaeon]|nr:hypothetical protein [Nanoarchaeota archaeon]